MTNTHTKDKTRRQQRHNCTYMQHRVYNVSNREVSVAEISAKHFDTNPKRLGKCKNKIHIGLHLLVE